MDVAFGDNLRCPRRLILEVNTKYPNQCYTTCSERDGVGNHSDYSLRTLEEWLEWVEKFRDEQTGKEMREVIEAAKTPFVEPKSWTDFRARYAETGDPWMPDEKLRHGSEPLPPAIGSPP